MKIQFLFKKIGALFAPEASQIRPFYKVLTIFLFPIVFIFYGCEAPPSSNEVKDVITQHFEARNYRVTIIDLGEINSLPIHEREYMAPKTYIVDVPFIELEVASPKGEYKQGQRLSF